MEKIYLAIAIISEVIATSSLKASQEFTNLLPSSIVITGYGISFYFLSMALKTISVGSAYAIWSGLGIVLVTIVAWIFYQQIPDLPAIIGMILIILGVIIMNVFSKTVSH